MYRPIDDRARYWGELSGGMRFGKLNLENFQRKKEKRILLGLETVLIPLTDQCNYH